MATLFQHVKPGDLIKAEVINSLLDQIEAMDVRLKSLENKDTTTEKLTILDLLPHATVKMGDEVRVLGKSFDLPTLSLAVAGFPITQFKSGSGDQLLIFDLRPIPTITSETLVMLTMNNANGFASWPFTIRPADTAVLTGQLTVKYSKAPTQAKLDAPGEYIFGFTINAQSSMAATYTLTADVSQAGWSATVVGPSEIQIPQSPPPEGTNREVEVKVNIPPGATVGTDTQVGLAITAKERPSLNSSRSIVLKVGSPPPAVLEKPISITLGNVFPPGSKVVSGATTIVEVPAGGAAAGVRFIAHTKAATAQLTYTITGPTVQADPGNLWKPEFKMSSRDFPIVPGADVDTTIITALSAAAGAPDTKLICG